MKSKSIGSLIALAILAPSCGGSSGGGGGVKNPPILVKWQTQQRVPTSSDLRGVVSTVSSFGHSGIVVGKDGSIFRFDDDNSLPDGSNILWTQQEFEQPNLTSHLSAVSANGSYLISVGQDLTTGNGRQYRCFDSTWWRTDTTPATGAVFTDVNVSSPGIGNVPGAWWMIRLDGTIDYYFQGLVGEFTTLDPTPPPPPVHTPPTHPILWNEANGILFVGTSGFGMVCGQEPAYAGYPDDPVAPAAYTAGGATPIEGMIIRTVDFGSSWIREDIDPTNMTVGTKTFRRMFLTTTDVGSFRAFVVGDDNNDNGIVLATNPDVPDQWQIVTSRPGTPPRFRALSFPVDDKLGYVVGDGGTIFRITSTYSISATPPYLRTYTYTWTPMTSGTTENLYAVSFVTKDIGYAVGDKGTVLKITNASTGTTWTKINRGRTGASFNAAAFMDDGMKGIAVGDGGVIVRTVDGGRHWTDMTNPVVTTDQLLGAAVPPDALGTTAYICGANNTILTNSDVWGAGAWSKVPGGNITGVSGTVTYQSILFPKDATNGICVGTQNGAGIVLRTTNSGGNWDPNGGTKPTYPNASYYGMVLNAPASTIYACGGADGKISLSSDLLTNWNVWGDATPAFPSALTLNSIAAPEGPVNKLYVAASDGKVWGLSNGGTPTWTQKAAPWAAEIPQSLGFQTDLNGLVVTNAGKIYTTINSGTAWNPSYVHSKDQPKALWVSRTVPGLGYAVANDGTIFKTTSLGQ